MTNRETVLKAGVPVVSVLVLVGDSDVTPLEICWKLSCPFITTTVIPISGSGAFDGFS